MATLSLKNINKIYPNNVQAVFDFNLDIEDKEFIVFVGPSGCGKSTTLRMVAGLESITSGKLYINNVLVNNVEPKDRDIAMVFQNYALYPHMTVYGNMAFALKLRKVLKPLYEDNPEVDNLRKDNNEILKKIKTLYKAASKNNESKETFDEIASLYDQIFVNEDKIEKLSIQKVGIYEDKIKDLETLNRDAAGFVHHLFPADPRDRLHVRYDDARFARMRLRRARGQLRGGSGKCFPPDDSRGDPRSCRGQRHQCRSQCRARQFPYQYRRVPAHRHDDFRRRAAGRSVCRRHGAGDFDFHFHHVHPDFHSQRDPAFRSLQTAGRIFRPAVGPRL